MRLLLGAAEAGFLPGIVYYLSQWFPRHAPRQSRVVVHDRHSAVDRVRRTVVGLVVRLRRTPRPARLAVDVPRAKACPPWCSVSSCSAFSPSKPAEAQWLTAEQREWLGRASKRRHRGGAGTSSRRVREVLAHPTVWLLAIIMFCCQTGSYGLTLWVPTIVKGLSGFTNLEVGFISALPYIAAAAGMVLIGRSSDRSGERFMHVAIPTAIGARRIRRHRHAQVADPRDDRADGRRGRRLRHARTVLGAAGEIPDRQRGRGRHRADQRHGRGRRVHRPVCRRISQGRVRQLRERPVPARRHPVGRRRSSRSSCATRRRSRTEC